MNEDLYLSLLRAITLLQKQSELIATLERQRDKAIKLANDANNTTRNVLDQLEQIQRLNRQ